MSVMSAIYFKIIFKSLNKLFQISVIDSLLYTRILYHKELILHGCIIFNEK